MTRPENSGDVLRVNGMANYLSSFLPNMSDVMKPLRDLTHKDVEWYWFDTQERAWSEVKSLIAYAPVLSYYKPNEPLEVQFDSSRAATAYASRALTETVPLRTDGKRNACYCFRHGEV